MKTTELVYKADKILASNKASVHNFMVWEFTPKIGGKKPPKPLTDN